MTFDLGDERLSPLCLSGPPGRGDSSTEPPLPDLPELGGRVLDDRYAIVRRIGRGGMASVFLARDERHDRDVAVKVLSLEASGAAAGQRFHREIRIAATLRHPHVVSVFDSGEVDGLLYFVMPYIAGESLRARLRRQPQLGVVEALAVARDVAAALDFAHARGIVHRDVKPENILLDNGRAVVADFGVALALGAHGGAGLTAQGVILGTPGYMSPEQASSDDAIDARSDVYALGCVVYEMLAGEPPFSGGSSRALIAKHLHATPVPLRVLRPSVGPLGDAVDVALAKAPADRYPSAGAFVHALETAAASAGVRSRRRTLAARSAALAALATAALATWGVAGRTGGALAPLGPALDSTAIAVFPFEGTDPLADAVPAATLVEDALRRWRGLTVVDPTESDPALAADPSRRSPRAVRALASSLGAGRYVRVSVSRAGDSLRVRATLHDTRAGSVLGEAMVRVSADAPPGDAAAREGPVSELVARVLFPRVDSATRALVRDRSMVPRAYGAFAEGIAAVHEWDLARADASFAAAADADPDFALASLWLAQVRSWERAVPARWRAAAERAVRGRARLGARERTLADALLALADGRHERACPMWERLADTGPDDFAAWYGLATCTYDDHVVVPDPTSPTGWRFRSSYHRTLQAYQRAFRIMPSIHRALGERSFAEVRRLFVTARNVVREGHALHADSLAFYARPVWAGDTLAFLPFPARPLTEPVRRPVAAATDEALKHQRRAFRDVAVAWVAAYPSSAVAIQALALALEMLGEPGAIDSLRRARALARDVAERRRLAVDEVWLRVKFALPGDLASLYGAARLADSLLAASADSVDGEDAELLAGLAALRGHAALAAALTRRAAPSRSGQEVDAVYRPARALLALAALGGPLDSLVALEREVTAAVDGAVTAPRQRGERLQWLARAATLAFPTVPLTSVRTLAATGDPLLDAQSAALAGDAPLARRRLDELRAAHDAVHPADRTLDALFPEAALLARLGDDRAAADLLDPTLRVLGATQPHAFADAVHAGSLVRAAALRAELAERAGDRAGARGWAAAVAALWTHADPFLVPLVARMQRLAR